MIENTTQEQSHYSNQPQIALPNATAVLILGISSIVTCCCYGVFGIILSIIALVLANKDRKLYFTNPQMYTVESYSNLKAGKVCALVGIILSFLALAYFIFVIATIGLANLQDPEALKAYFESMQ